MATELLVVRHGETEWNATGRIQGHLDVGLNERGRLQAEAVAERLAGEIFSALYSSDLKRSIETAEAIGATAGHQVIPDAQLREWDLGVLAGLMRIEAETQFPEAYRIYAEGIVGAVVQEGESIRQRYERTTGRLEAIAAAHIGMRVVVVTHGGALDDFYRQAKRMTLEAEKDFELFNAGVNTFEIADGVWTLKQWGDVRHLEAIGTMGNWEGKDS